MQILDTPAEEAFDRIIRIAAGFFEAPIVQVSLVDETREWFKAACGSSSKEGDRQTAFCSHTILTNEVLIVEDARLDPRFAQSPLVTNEGIRFYAGAPLRTRDGMNLGALCVKDVVPRKFTAENRKLLTELAAIVIDQMEQRLIAMRAEGANVAKTMFLANMSHELRTPLNAIIGYSEILQEDAAAEGRNDFVADLQKIHSAGRHLLALINDVLDLAKIEAGRMELHIERFLVADLIRDVKSTIDPLAGKNENRLIVDVAADVGEMCADELKVRQSLFNLLSNASKFTQKGEVRLRVWRTRGGKLGDTLFFEVKDSGIGMSESQLGNLFDAFVQADSSISRKFGGTGLGLAITRRFCRMMGGDVSVTSESGKGSTFTIQLPAEVIDAPKAEREARTATSPETAATGPTVLVIDDDATARELMTRTLAREGFHVVCASSADEGIELARQMKPSVIALDIMMPRRDGWSALAELKSNPTLRETPVILTTIVDARARGFELGAVDYCTKPIDFDRLIATVHRHADAGRPGGVLVVDNEEPVRSLIARQLRGTGVSVMEAANGVEALRQLDRATPALILLDLMMPEMDGFEFLRALRGRAEWATLPVVIITAKELMPEERAELESQTMALLEKGRYAAADLLELVKRNVVTRQVDACERGSASL
jgi:signal transduction histidine kinase/DNA-binding response OmpR family regulator